MWLSGLDILSACLDLSQQWMEIIRNTGLLLRTGILQTLFLSYQHYLQFCLGFNPIQALTSLRQWGDWTAVLFTVNIRMIHLHQASFCSSSVAERALINSEWNWFSKLLFNICYASRNTQGKAVTEMYKKLLHEQLA